MPLIAVMAVQHHQNHAKNIIISTGSKLQKQNRQLGPCIRLFGLIKYMAQSLLYIYNSVVRSIVMT